MAQTGAMESLLSELRDRKSIQLHAQSDKGQWLRDLDALMTQLDVWAKPLVDAGLLEAASSSQPIHEPDLGSYQVPTRSYSFPGSGAWMSVEPRGMRIAGAVLGPGKAVTDCVGRVDLGSANGEHLRLFRQQPGDATHSAIWQIVGDLPDRHGFVHALDEDTFALALKWLLP